jgi:hypothetical protein
MAGLACRKPALLTPNSGETSGSLDEGDCRMQEFVPGWRIAGTRADPYAVNVKEGYVVSMTVKPATPSLIVCLTEGAGACSASMEFTRPGPAVFYVTSENVGQGDYTLTVSMRRGGLPVVPGSQGQTPPSASLVLTSAGAGFCADKFLLGPNWKAWSPANWSEIECSPGRTANPLKQMQVRRDAISARADVWFRYRATTGEGGSLQTHAACFPMSASAVELSMLAANPDREGDCTAPAPESEPEPALRPVAKLPEAAAPVDTPAADAAGAQASPPDEQTESAPPDFDCRVENLAPEQGGGPTIGCTLKPDVQLRDGQVLFTFSVQFEGSSTFVPAGRPVEVDRNALSADYKMSARPFPGLWRIGLSVAGQQIGGSLDLPFPGGVAPAQPPAEAPAEPGFACRVVDQGQDQADGKTIGCTLRHGVELGDGALLFEFTILKEDGSAFEPAGPAVGVDRNALDAEYKMAAKGVPGRYRITLSAGGQPIGDAVQLTIAAP